eukprot:gene3083-5253_t
MKEKKKSSHQDVAHYNSQEEKLKYEQKQIIDFWKRLPSPNKRKVIKVDKLVLLKEIKENNGHVCSCTVCGRRRAVFGKEIERRLVEYCKELEYKGSLKTEQTTQKRIQLEKLRRKIFLQQSYNRRMILKFKPNYSLTTRQPEYSESEMTKEEFVSYNFSKNLIIDDTGFITLKDDYLNENSETIFELLAKIEQVDQPQSSLFPTGPGHHVSNSGQPRRIKNGNEEDDDDDEEEEDEEEYEDEDEEEYDSQEEDEDEDDDEDEQSEEQRWRQSRKMFRLNIAKLFLKSIIMAYKEKKALELQQRLIEEEEREESEKNKNNKKKSKKQKKKEKNEKKKREKEMLEKQRIDKEKDEEYDRRRELERQKDIELEKKLQKQREMEEAIHAEEEKEEKRLKELEEKQQQEIERQKEFYEQQEEERLKKQKEIEKEETKKKIFASPDPWKSSPTITHQNSTPEVFSSNSSTPELGPQQNGIKKQNGKHHQQIQTPQQPPMDNFVLNSKSSSVLNDSNASKLIGKQKIVGSEKFDNSTNVDDFLGPNFNWISF